MDTISKNFTGFDVFGMFIPGSIFLFALGYLIGVDDYNIFIVLKDMNYILAVIVYLTLCYVVGTIMSNLGSIMTFIFNKIYDNNDIDATDEKIKNILVNKYEYDEDDFKKNKSNNYSKEKILSAARKVIQINPNYRRINVFLSLTAISKSMFMVVILITIIQFFFGEIEQISLYWINVILLTVFGFRCFRMWKKCNEYTRNYFILEHKK